MAKVHGPENPADLMTKFLDADTMYRHLKKLGLKVRIERCRLRILREGRTLPTGGMSSERRKLRVLRLG
eukprot:3505956-Amphidinium_carterae.1